MSGAEGSIFIAIFSGLTLLRDSIRLLYNFHETYQKRRDELKEKANTLENHIGDIRQQTGEATQKGEIIKNGVEDWLGRAQKVVEEHSSFRNPSAGGGVCFSNPFWRCKAIKKVKKLDSRLTDVIAKVPTREVSRRRPLPPIDLKKKLEELGTGRVERLRCIIKDVKRRVEEATAKDDIILNTVEHWQKTSEDLVREHSRLLEKRDGGEISNGSPLREALVRLESLESRLDQAIAEAPSEKVSDPRPPPPNAAEKIEIDFSVEMNSSTETALEEVMEALKSPGVTVVVVGVHGIPGVGKTTIVQRAADKATAEGDGKLFERLVFFTISSSPDLEKIRRKIADDLGVSAERVMDKLKRERNVLIVLDDIWEELVLTKVGIPNCRDLEQLGSKIVFTSRDEHVCSLMQCQKKVHLKIWSGQESREFLKKAAGITEDFENIAESVADECKGLPLALNVVAKALRDKSLEEWKQALKRLRDSESLDPHYADKVFSSVKLSYDYLKPSASMCFLLCCLFPEDHNIRCEELARYAFGLGLFRHAHSVDKVRDETGTVVEMLKDCGLLLPVDRDLNRERVKMHDVIRDVAIQLVSANNHEETKQVFLVQSRNQEQQEWPDMESFEIYTAISIISNKIHALPGTPDCPKLEILLLQDNPNLTKITSSFFFKMKALRLLDLNRVRTKLLPPSTMSLKMLRTLHLDGCELLKDFSVLGKLENLAILSLRESVIEEVPESMGNLSKLRMLDLTLSRSIKRIPPNVFSRMASLEEVYLKGSFSQWRNETQIETIHNASFYELINLHRLTILEVDVADAKSLLNFEVKEAPRWSKFDICVCSVAMTRSMNFNPSRRDNVTTKNLLIDISIKEFPNWFIEAVVKKTEKVTYADAKKFNMFEEQAKGRLARLKFLVLDKYTWVLYLTWDISDSNPVFESLEELEINDSSISETCDGDLPPGSFQKLKSLTVKNCHEMGATVLSSGFIKRVHNLRTLYLIRANAKAVFTVPENHDQEQRYLGKLREMRLEDLYELETVWKAPARSADFGNLKLVLIFKCEQLRHLFSVDIFSNLSNLEDLWVEDCNEMQAIIGDSDEEITPETATLTLPNLKTLCLLDLPKLTNFCSGNLKLQCPVLVNVHIHNCNIDFPITYFNSSKEVHKNNQQHMKTLKKRMSREYI